jgi:hypothetical protein
MVGFSPKKNLIYLAVLVRDDSLVVQATDHWHTDACAVYVDGAHRGDKFKLSFLRSVFAATFNSKYRTASLQYVMYPPGRSSEDKGHGEPSANPALIADVSLDFCSQNHYFLGVFDPTTSPL